MKTNGSIVWSDQPYACIMFFNLHWFSGELYKYRTQNGEYKQKNTNNNQAKKKKKKKKYSYLQSLSFRIYRK